MEALGRPRQLQGGLGSVGNLADEGKIGGSPPQKLSAKEELNPKRRSTRNLRKMTRNLRKVTPKDRQRISISPPQLWGQEREKEYLAASSLRMVGGLRQDLQFQIHRSRRWATRWDNALCATAYVVHRPTFQCPQSRLYAIYSNRKATLDTDGPYG